MAHVLFSLRDQKPSTMGAFQGASFPRKDASECKAEEPYFHILWKGLERKTLS